MSHRLAVAGVLVLGVASCAGHSSEGGLSGDSTPPLTQLALPPLDTAPAPTTLPAQDANGRPDLAPADVQTAVAEWLSTQRGFSPWPNTAPECGA